MAVSNLHSGPTGTVVVSFNGSGRALFKPILDEDNRLMIKEYEVDSASPYTRFDTKLPLDRVVKIRYKSPIYESVLRKADNIYTTKEYVNPKIVDIDDGEELLILHLTYESYIIT